ncbi:MAG TPA: cobalamin-independent methionine synthase II family protein, partial [Vicinamibacterales bacterium]|nr:cobalamin-independent methionine synthase II family protein [Vicinamibacterales bacterium]
VGRLDGPAEMRSIMQTFRTGGTIDAAALAALLPTATAFVLHKQVEAGIDIVSNGEVGAIGYGIAHYGKRLTGLTARKVSPDDPAWMSLRTGERLEFAEFYKEFSWVTPGERVVVTGPIGFVGAAEIQRDIGTFTAALKDAGRDPADAFMCALAPGWLEHFFHNEHYPSDEAYVFALADAMRHEYSAIIDAGFVLQIDDPALPDTYDMIVPAPPIEEYRNFAEIRVEALNHALRGLPEDRIRYHVCWGSWHGPHTHDLPLAHILDLVLKVNAGAYSIEAANPRHEHEWKLWKTTKLPEGKILIPGVVSHATNVVEHPELIADRIVRFAGLVGRENVIASTDCGLGFRVHAQIAWAKLKALSEGAALATQQLYR